MPDLLGILVSARYSRQAGPPPRIEQRLIVDLRRDLSDKLAPDIDAGYAFNRFLGVGDGMGNTQ